MESKSNLKKARDIHIKNNLLNLKLRVVFNYLQRVMRHYKDTKTENFPKYLGFLSFFQAVIVFSVCLFSLFFNNFTSLQILNKHASSFFQFTNIFSGLEILSSA